MRTNIVLLLVATGLACGCTSVETLPDVHRSARNQALTGMPYSLPMRQFGLQVTRTLTQCDNDAATTPAQRIIKFDVKVVADPQLVPGERYRVDYAALSSWVKTSDFAIDTYPAGTLKSINISADDKSDQVIKAVVKTGLTVASVGLGVPFPGLNVQSLNYLKSGNGTEPEAQKVAVRCTSETRTALAAVTSTKATLKTETEALEEKNRQVEALALVGAITEEQKAALIKLLAEQRAQVKTLEKARKAYSDALDAVSATETRFWPTDFGKGGVAAEAIDIGEAEQVKLGKLFNVFPVPEDTVETSCIGQNVTVASCIEPELTLHARLEPRLASGVCAQDNSLFNCTRPAGTAYPRADQPLVGQARAEFLRKAAEARVSEITPSRDMTSDNGIFVRPPEMGRIVVCRKEAGCAIGSDNSLLVGEWLTVPQLGQLRFLPFINRMFENNQLVVQLGADGAVERFQYASKAAMLQRLADTAADAAAQYKTAKKDAREEIAASRAEEVAQLQQQITMITKEKELDALQNPKAPEPDPMKEAQLQLVRAQAELLVAQAELARRPD